MINTPWILGELQRTLGLLAAPAEEQIAYLRENRVHHDELALDFDAVAPVAGALYEDGELSEAQLRAIEAVDRKLDEMSGAAHALQWTDEGLRNADNWKKVRLLARDAFVALVEG